MQLPGERMKPLFEIRQVERELPRHAKKREAIGAGRQRLNFSARGAKVRSAGSRGTTPARQRRCGSDGGCAHDLITLPPEIPRWRAERTSVAKAPDLDPPDVAADGSLALPH